MVVTSNNGEDYYHDISNEAEHLSGDTYEAHIKERKGHWVKVYNGALGQYVWEDERYYNK